MVACSLPLKGEEVLLHTVLDVADVTRKISGKGVENSCPFSVSVCPCVSFWIWGTLRSGISELQKPNESKRKDLWLFWSVICYGKCKIQSNNLPIKWVSKQILHFHNDHTEFRRGVFHWQSYGTIDISHPHTPFPIYSCLAISNGRPQVSFKIHQCIIERYGGAMIPLFPKNKGTFTWPTGRFACHFLCVWVVFCLLPPMQFVMWGKISLLLPLYLSVIWK